MFNLFVNPQNYRLMRAVCGLDVHKDTVYLCILCSDGEIIEKVFGVLTFQLLDMRRLMQSHGVTEVTMESTAMYWIPVWRVLEPHFRLKLVNPYFIRQLPGRKSDVKDAEWIAVCTMKDLVRGSFVPPERIQQLRQYDRRIFDLDAEIVRKLSKLDGIMQRCNIRLSNYVSNTDTKSYKEVVDMLCDGITDPEELVKKVHGRIVNKHGRETILASLTGVVSEAEKDTMRQLREEITLAETHKRECLDKMLQICNTYYPNGLRRLMTIPGIKERAATSLIAEIGRHDQIPDCGAPCIMERAEATQRRIQREVQVAQDHTRQRVPPKDHHRVRMGGKPHPGLLLQPLLLPPDRGAQEEQDEGPRGSRQKTAHRGVARAA